MSSGKHTKANSNGDESHIVDEADIVFACATEVAYN